MKSLHFNKLMFAMAVLATAFFFTGCKSKKKAAAPDYSALGTEVVTPCSDNEYYSTATHFRGTGIGEGTNLASSRRKANLDANAMLAASINRTIKSVTDRYTQDITIGDVNEFNEKFEDLTRSVVNQVLNNVATVCNQMFEKDGKYTVYMAVEVGKDELLDNVASRISRDERLRLDYDKMKFEQIFNEEMERLSNERP
jgi:hypothetical protein